MCPNLTFYFNKSKLQLYSIMSVLRLFAFYFVVSLEWIVGCRNAIDWDALNYLIRKKMPIRPTLPETVYTSLAKFPRKCCHVRYQRLMCFLIARITCLCKSGPILMECRSAFCLHYNTESFYHSSPFEEK